MSALLTAENLTHAYGEKTLFRRVSLSVPAGQCLAFVGHNGTGKTTLLKILAGLVVQTGGTVTRQKSLSIAYVPEHFPRPPLTALDFLRHMGRIEGLSRQEAETRAAALLTDFFMDSMTGVQMRHLSKGSLQKVGVVQALLRPHDILLLDEPLSGQDIASQQVFIEKMRRAKADGCAILLSCHEPYLVNRLADRVLELRGRALHELSLSDPRFAEHALLVFAHDPQTQPLPDFLAAYKTQAEGRDLSVLAPQAEGNAIAARMIGAGFTLKEYRDESHA